MVVKAWKSTLHCAGSNHRFILNSKQSGLHKSEELGIHLLFQQNGNLDLHKDAQGHRKSKKKHTRTNKSGVTQAWPTIRSSSQHKTAGSRAVQSGNSASKSVPQYSTLHNKQNHSPLSNRLVRSTEFTEIWKTSILVLTFECCPPSTNTDTQTQNHFKAAYLLLNSAQMLVGKGCF